MRAVIVGAGPITLDLLRRLGEGWEVAVIDLSAERIAKAEAVRSVQAIVGDGTSRLSLERANLAEADAFIAATDDDEANLEACRLAQESGVLRTTAVVADSSRLADYRRAGIAAVTPSQLAARHLEINLERRRVTSAAFANGLAEAAEFRIAGDSPLAGRRLQDLQMTSWLVAAVLRDDQLIVPHGGTVLEEGDLVTVVGSAEDYGSMVATFTGGEASFPLGYGKYVAVAVPGVGDWHENPTVAEAANFVKATASEALLVMHQIPETNGTEDAGEPQNLLVSHFSEIDVRFKPVGKLGTSALVEACAENNVGTVVLDKPSGRSRVARTLESLRATGTPMLLSSGGWPYQSVLVEAPDSDEKWGVAHAAIDIAAHSGTPLTGVGLVPPNFIAGEDALGIAREALVRLREEAAVQGVSARRETRQGNPVRSMVELAPGNLVVLPLADRGVSALKMGNVGHFVMRTASSVLLIPASRPE